jgi:Zn-dependent protease with chaperone function
VAQLFSLGIMRTLLKYFLPPLAPVLPLIAFALCVAIAEAYSPVRIIDGHPDGAPTDAAGVVLLLSFIIYLGLLLIQFLCLKFRRASSNFFTPYVIAVVGCTLLLGCRDICLADWIALGFCAMVCSVVIFPMAIFSWVISRWMTKQYDA